MSAPRWTAVSESPFPWEAEAIAWLSQRLPESDAYRGFSSFEVVSQDGTVNEVDSLILPPTKLLLVELCRGPVQSGHRRADPPPGTADIG
jgi:hypothetical protein